MKACKLIAKSTARRAENEKDYEDDIYLYEIPNAQIINSFSSELGMEGVSAYDLIIEILPFNENDDLFKMHLYR